MIWLLNGIATYTVFCLKLQIPHPNNEIPSNKLIDSFAFLFHFVFRQDNKLQSFNRLEVTTRHHAQSDKEYIKWSI